MKFQTWKKINIRNYLPLHNHDSPEILNYLSSRNKKIVNPLVLPQLSSVNTLKQIESCPYLKSGCIFEGYQENHDLKNFVQIRFDQINFNNFNIPNITGHLTIEGLAEFEPILTTLFDAFIIDGNYKHLLSSKWQNGEYFTQFKTKDKYDESFWNEFDMNIVETFKLNSFNKNFNGLINERFICLKLKERIFDIDEKIDEIDGVSFKGFYYIIMYLFDGSLRGIYHGVDSPGRQTLYLNSTLITENMELNTSLYLL